MDELDKNILNILRENARTPIIKTAKKLNIPDTTVHFRIRKMERGGLIKGYKVVLNKKNLGIDNFALVKIKTRKYIIPEIEERKEAELIKKLTQDFHLILNAFSSDEDVCYLLVGLESKDKAKFQKTLEENSFVENFEVVSISKVDLF